MKTPLRYPGGKSRAVKHILPHIPKNLGKDGLCSPFLGGGSVELAVAARDEGRTTVYGYDLFEPLVCFWQKLLGNPEKLANRSDKLRREHENYILNEKDVRGLLREDFIRLREELRVELESKLGYSLDSLDNAAKFYAINRSSFSGATFSGGWSERASYARFTDSSIERIRKFSEPNLKVKHAHFKTSIAKHPRAFLYLDPPYYLGKQKDKLYGIKGDAHSAFDHEGLYECLSKRTNWVLSYNDCEYVRDKYSGYEIIEAAWAYGMKNVKAKNITEKKEMGSSSELLIIGQ